MRRNIFISIVSIAVSFGIGFEAREAGSAAGDVDMKTMVVLDMSCGAGVSGELCSDLSDMLVEESAAVSGYTFVQKSKRDAVLGGRAACSDEACAINAGKVLGAGMVVFGDISCSSEVCPVRIRMINVKTAVIEGSVKASFPLIAGDVRDIFRGLAAEVMRRAPDTSAIPEPVQSQMVLIPSGEFDMGCDPKKDQVCIWNTYPEEKPLHKVYLDAYKIDKYEVTMEQYDQCYRAGVCSKGGTDKSCNWDVPGRGNYPVNCVEWEWADTFCKWAGKRLPTEAEWEKAARGTDGRTHPWGKEDATCEFAVMLENKKSGCGTGLVNPVGTKSRDVSPYGVMDMGGNLSEWVSDWFAPDYYATSPNRNPTGPASGNLKTVRGGNYTSFAQELRTPYRNSNAPDSQVSFYGFRCAANP